MHLGKYCGREKPNGNLINSAIRSFNSHGSGTPDRASLSERLTNLTRFGLDREKLAAKVREVSLYRYTSKLAIVGCVRKVLSHVTDFVFANFGIGRTATKFFTYITLFDLFGPGFADQRCGRVALGL